MIHMITQRCIMYPRVQFTYSSDSASILISLSSLSDSVRRRASAMIDTIWYVRPVQLNRCSPAVLTMTPVVRIQMRDMVTLLYACNMVI